MTKYTTSTCAEVTYIYILITTCIRLVKFWKHILLLREYVYTFADEMQRGKLKFRLPLSHSHSANVCTASGRSASWQLIIQATFAHPKSSGECGLRCSCGRAYIYTTLHECSARYRVGGKRGCREREREKQKYISSFEIVTMINRHAATIYIRVSVNT